MTTTTDRPAVTYCPRWCKEERDIHNVGRHESGLTYIDLPRGAGTLFVNVEQSATDPAGCPSVAVHNGDDHVLDASPSTMRSLAAALVHAADVAEGLR